MWQFLLRNESIALGIGRHHHFFDGLWIELLGLIASFTGPSLLTASLDIRFRCCISCDSWSNQGRIIENEYLGIWFTEIKWPDTQRSGNSVVRGNSEKRSRGLFAAYLVFIGTFLSSDEILYDLRIVNLSWIVHDAIDIWIPVCIGSLCSRF